MDGGYDAGVDAGPMLCGNGVIDDGETCDPGNLNTAGCGGDCLQLGGYRCWGQPSVCFEEASHPIVVFPDDVGGATLVATIESIGANGVIFLAGMELGFHINPDTTDDITLVGQPGTLLFRNGGRELIKTEGTGTLTLVGLRLTHDYNGSGETVVKAQKGDVVLDRCELFGAATGIAHDAADSQARFVVRRSWVHTFSASGIHGLNGNFLVENSLIEDIEGPAILADEEPIAVRFNTIVDGEDNGITCDVPMGHIAANVFSNIAGVSGSANCEMAHSFLDSDEGAPGSGTNSNDAPLLGGDRRPLPASPLRNYIPLGAGVADALLDGGVPAVTDDRDLQHRPTETGYEPGCHELP
jgi:hypothetical protein